MVSPKIQIQLTESLIVGSANFKLFEKILVGFPGCLTFCLETSF